MRLGCTLTTVWFAHPFSADSPTLHCPLPHPVQGRVDVAAQESFWASGGTRVVPHLN